MAKIRAKTMIVTQHRQMLKNKLTLNLFSRLFYSKQFHKHVGTFKLKQILPRENVHKMISI